MPRPEDFDYEELAAKGYIRTVRTPKAKALTIDERLAALESENASLKARVAKVEKAQKASNPA